MNDTHGESGQGWYGFDLGRIGEEYDVRHLDAAIHEFPLEVIATHTAGMLASQYDEIGA